MDYDQKLPTWTQDLQDEWLKTLPLFVSIPRPGCNWLQAVMELYFDRHHAGKGVNNPSWLESKFEQPMWMHTHDNFANEGEGNLLTDKPAIFLWRDPVDVIYSLLRLQGVPPSAINIIGVKCNSFAHLFSKWTNNDNVLVVKYDKVLENPMKEMHRISEWHDVPFDKERAQWAFDTVGGKKKTNEKNGAAPHFKNKESGSASYEMGREAFRKQMGGMIYNTISKLLGSSNE